MKRITRLATVALLTGAAAVTAGTQTAAADPGWCHGSEVTTCIKLEVEGNRARAVATARDVDGGTDFGVDVRWVELQVFNRTLNKWQKLAGTYEEGYETHFDVAASGWDDCAGHGGIMQFRAAGWYKWRVAPDGSPSYDEMTTKPFGISCAP
ncbi:hypothetical protein GCM10029976_093350 [Kribbella albertanoniae]|uniref:Secreted protein n=1 Tax=Kribbella albertanoniae TaxID=1266829 RepID=A0A4R4Q207_9ACTN|nr:hypothetical protein [Kribbella albertanoniae]TDC29041.1 hypothetical protein E1261_16725 [Kribbella albertanoniae]